MKKTSSFLWPSPVPLLWEPLVKTQPVSQSLMMIVSILLSNNLFMRCIRWIEQLAHLVAENHCVLRINWTLVLYYKLESQYLTTKIAYWRMSVVNSLVHIIIVYVTQTSGMAPPPICNIACFSMLMHSLSHLFMFNLFVQFHSSALHLRISLFLKVLLM